jgi:hypothetical protein
MMTCDVKQLKINVSDVPAGVYILSISDGDNNRMSSNVVISH